MKFTPEQEAEIRRLRKEYDERLEMYYDGLTHRGEVIALRAFLVSIGEDIPELLY